MVAITASEKKAIVEAFPNVHITRTMKSRSKRHHYYMEEAPGAMRMLRSLRGEQEPARRKDKRQRSARGDC